MITGYDNGEQISKYVDAVIHIFLVRGNFSGECEMRNRFQGINTAPSRSPLILQMSDHFFFLFWDNCAFGSI